MEGEEHSASSVQSVEIDRLNMDEEGIFQNENRNSGAANNINDLDPLKYMDIEIVDKYETDIKTEGENREIVEPKELQKEMKSETKVSDDYNFNNPENLGVGDFVKDEIEEGI